MAENDNEATEAAPQAKLGMMQLLMIIGIVLVTEVGILFAWESMRPDPPAAGCRPKAVYTPDG